MKKPHVLLKVAVSIDGCIDDASPQRRVFSSPEDQSKVDQLRAGCDAILVGAKTVRADNPRLLVRSGKLRRKRQQQGRATDVTKVTLTRSGDLDSKLNFFQVGKGDRLVYAPRQTAEKLAGDLYGLATVVACAGLDVSLEFLLNDLYERGVRKLIVEGGTSIISLFLKSRLVSELRLAVAPCFISDPRAPQLVNETIFSSYGNHLVLKSVEQLGNTAILNYSVALL
jgi:riboflavin-specific deaminase-like protein